MEWKGKLTREQAIRLIDKITDQDDPYWDYIVEDYYDEDADTMPSIQHLYDALGITREEYVAATGDTGVDWPDEDRMDIIGQNGNNGEHYDNA